MLLAFIMVPIVQKEVNNFKDTIWNVHRIRAQKDTVLPDGIPNHIYSFPEKYGLQDCGMTYYLTSGAFSIVTLVKILMLFITFCINKNLHK